MSNYTDELMSIVNGNGLGDIVDVLSEKGIAFTFYENGYANVYLELARTDEMGNATFVWISCIDGEEYTICVYETNNPDEPFARFDTNSPDVVAAFAYVYYAAIGWSSD